MEVPGNKDLSNMMNGDILNSVKEPILNDKPKGRKPGDPLHRKPMSLTWGASGKIPEERIRAAMERVTRREALGCQMIWPED